jgi:signal transduction histidine kinase
MAMLEFYTWPRAAVYVTTFLFFACILTQTVAAILSFYRRPRSLRWACEALLEGFAAVQVFVCSLMHGQAIEGYNFGVVPQTEYALSRYMVFTVIILLATTVVALTRKPWQLLTAAAAYLTLPAMEQFTGGFFAYIFFMSVLFWLARGIRICSARYAEIRANLSALSIKEAVDSLHSGVMFCEQDGFILIANTQMQRFMEATTGKTHRNGRQFYGLLTLGDIDPRCRITLFEEQYVVVLPDGSAWKTSLTELPIKKKKYTQITVTDISEQWKLTTELQPQNEALLRRQDELSKILANLHLLSRERETQRAKMRAHDILGERLTLLLRMLRNEQAPDYVMLRNMSLRFVDELKAIYDNPAPREELDTLKLSFESIGVEIVINGSLPEDRAKGRLFTDIIREAITNAVRHGLATRVNIHMDDSDGDFHLRVTDNGHPPPSDAVREGGGISGMRKKLEPFNGALHVVTHPRFVLAVSLPGGDSDSVD